MRTAASMMVYLHNHEVVSVGRHLSTFSFTISSENRRVGLGALVGIFLIVFASLLPKTYRAEKKGWYVVARYFFLALLSFSAWLCLGPA